MTDKQQEAQIMKRFIRVLQKNPGDYEDLVMAFKRIHPNLYKKMYRDSKEIATEWTNNRDAKLIIKDL